MFGLDGVKFKELQKQFLMRLKNLVISLPAITELITNIKE